MEKKACNDRLSFEAGSGGPRLAVPRQSVANTRKVALSLLFVYSLAMFSERVAAIHRATLLALPGHDGLGHHPTASRAASSRVGGSPAHAVLSLTGQTVYERGNFNAGVQSPWVRWGHAAKKAEKYSRLLAIFDDATISVRRQSTVPPSPPAATAAACLHPARSRGTSAG